jgi:hypothetical protein
MTFPRWWVPMTALALAGCVRAPVGPVRDAATFATKAERTVADARSAVATADLAVTGEREGRAFTEYTVDVLDGAAEALGAADETFDSIVPPDDASRELRTKVLDELDESGGAIGDARVAVAGRDDAGLEEAAAALREARSRLDALAAEVGA